MLNTLEFHPRQSAPYVFEEGEMSITAGVLPGVNLGLSKALLSLHSLLAREELWCYVTPGEKPDAIWSAGNAKARTTIGLLIGDNQYPLIWCRSSKTAKEAWTALQNHYQKISLTSKVSLLLKRICD